MYKTLLIFDFDGTIADTLAIANEILNELGPEFGMRHVSKEEFVELKNKKISELLKMSGLSMFQVPRFLKRARDRFKVHHNRVNPIQEMPEIIHALQKRGYRLGILTSNSPSSVSQFLDKNGIEGIEFIHSPRSIFGKGKMLKNIMKKYKISPCDIVMIGDEVRDMQAAHDAKVDAVAVTWGFNSAQLLNQSHPQQLVSVPQDLLNIFPPRILA